MDPSLQATIALFTLYGIVGFIPLNWARTSSSRKERFASGIMLIYFGAVLLTGLALVTGLADTLAETNRLDSAERKQLGDFMQFVIFGGFVFTFLFGGVGTNMVTLALTGTDNLDIIEQLNHIEAKIDKNKAEIESLTKSHKSLWFIYPLFVIAGVLLLWFVW